MVFKGRKLGVYTTWHDYSDQVLGYPGVVHRKYSSYEHAVHDFNSTINSTALPNPSTNFVEKQSEGTGSGFCYKNVAIVLLCLLVSIMRMKLSSCRAC